eukprot:m.102425 g.102425  ORF g.102425 m.102425 type:complete len:186 (+) comp9008_c0_seq1:56-613(+)
MFKKFSQKDNISSTTLVKTSVGRGIRTRILESMPALEPILPVIMPKKAPLYLVKCRDHITFVAANQELLFFQHYDGPFVPTLRLLHKYPHILPQQQVDRGAIKFVLKGADIMCPGLTSPGAKLVPAEKEAIVAIMAEGKTHALGIGKMVMSSEELAEVNKGVGVESLHYLGDGLFNLDEAALNIK